MKTITLAFRPHAAKKLAELALLEAMRRAAKTPKEWVSNERREAVSQ